MSQIEWIEHKGNDCPIPNVKAGKYAIKWYDDKTWVPRSLHAHEISAWDINISLKPHTNIIKAYALITPEQAEALRSSNGR